MDIFTVDKATYAPLENVYNLDSVMWVERYNKPGEFQIVCEPNSDNLTNLSATGGSFISHPNTLDIMSVETMVIEDNMDGKAKLHVSGRSISAIAMENRVITLNRTTAGTWVADALGDTSIYPMEFNLAATNIYDQVVTLLQRYLENSDFGARENLPNFYVANNVSGWVDVTPPVRIPKRLSYLSDAVYALLEAGDLGVRVLRPDYSTSALRFIVHMGVDRNESVRFYQGSNDLRSTRYVWSNKGIKNEFYSHANGTTLFSEETAYEGWETKIASVDVMDWDHEDVNSEGADLVTVLYSRGKEAISSAYQIELIDAKVNATQFKYGIDYNIGDLVYVAPSYSIGRAMRVIEHAITVDDSGEDFVTTVARPYALDNMEPGGGV